MAEESISMESESRDRSDTSSGIALLLGHRFGDGLVYFRHEGERKLFNLAVEWGLLQPGRVSHAGRLFVPRHARRRLTETPPGAANHHPFFFAGPR